MSEDALKAALDELLGALDFDTETAAQVIGAAAELIRRLRTQGGGRGELYLDGSVNERKKFVLHSPSLVVVEKFRRRA